MLISFEFSNYASFKDDALLSLETGEDREHPEHLISYQNETFLPAAAIYGANDSGKTNIHRAMEFAVQMIRTSAALPVGSPIPVRPFLLDDTSRHEPSTFEFDLVHNGRHFLYRFACTRERILEESLYEFKTRRKSRIFERTKGDQYSFTKALKSHFTPLVRMTAPNKLFLSVATTWNSPYTQDAWLWFLEGIDILDQDVLRRDQLESMYSDQSLELKTFTLNLLRHADLPVSDYGLEVRLRAPSREPYPDQPSLPPELQKSTMKVIKEKRMMIRHQMEDEEGIHEMNLPIEQEGRGMQILLAYAPFLFEALRKGKTLVLDELDTSLHPELVGYLISIFQDLEINPNGAQLIFNTQDATQLCLTQFRRDQIYFTERSRKTGISELFSLDDFKPRAGENIEKAYLVGRFGAIPYVRKELLQCETEESR